MSAIESASETETYAAVGRALSRWETFEIALAELYAFLKGQPGDLRLIREICDEGRVFAGRLATVQEAARRFFVRFCDQDLEGEVAALVERAKGQSLERNRIAHGIVECGMFMERDGRVVEGCFLVPPWYAMKRLRLKPDSNISAAEIDKISTEFLNLGENTRAVARAVLRSSS